MHPNIIAYNNAQTEEYNTICRMLADEIQTALGGLPHAENKIWHGSPVWFLAGNPIVGYSILKSGVRLLFWSGQSFEEPGLQQEGSFKAAEVTYTDASQIDSAALQRWLAKAQRIQWDYKNIVKRKGQLLPLTLP